MGARVVLIEKHKMGGDCLNYGCVPSKSLVAAAHAAQQVRTSGRFGVNGHEPDVRFRDVHDHVHNVIAGIAPHDSVERFEGLGVNVIQAAGRFVGPNALMAGETHIKARRVVIATGSRAAIPDLPGLDDVPYLTNETVFDLTERPEHLVVVGGGPIGVELAQAHRRLGAEVTLIQRSRLMPKDDVDAVEVIRRSLLAEGVAVHEHAEISGVEREGNRVAVRLVSGGRNVHVIGSHLLIAAGRQPNIGGLDLAAAGITHDRRGIQVDARLRTSNKRVFAIGDVNGGYQFTHVAGYQAGIVIRNALFNLPAKVDERAVPWVTYADPELAQVGHTEASAAEHGIEVTTTRFDFAENDRARAERATEGFVKAIVGKRGVVLGATIVGPHAGELLMPWILAVQKSLKIGDVASLIVPYPTLSEVSKRAAGAYFTPALFSPRTAKVVRAMQYLP